MIKSRTAFPYPRRRCTRLALGALILLISAAPGWAQPPAGYYDTVDTTGPTALRITLHEVIDDHTRLPYTASTTDTWDILNMADEDPGNPNNIIDIYRNASYTKMTGGIGAYNREHVWPNSLGFPNDGDDNSAYTDCHALFLSDAGYNSSRSNKPFRNCTAACVEEPTLFNDGRGGGSGVYSGNSNWTTGSFTAGTWETWNGRKGDVARAIFYMDLRYEGGFHNATGFDEPDLELTDDDALIELFRTGQNEPLAYMGILSVLLQWHQMDPVDSRELWRNEVVFSFQGNRNPFIDHPEWVQCIYSSICDGGPPDTDPPAAPSGLIATPAAGRIDLAWLANTEPDLAGYDIFRSTTSGGPYSQLNGVRLTTASYADTAVNFGTTYFYVVRAADFAGNLSGNGNEASASPLEPAGTPQVLLSEVLYDVSGGDDGFEWVELYNAGTAPADLSGYSLGNGGTSYTASLVQLGGTLAPGATLVIGGPTSSATNANPIFDLVVNFSPDFQNSGSAADGVALFDVPAASVSGATVPIDAVLYGPTNSNGLIDETGVANPPEVGDASGGSSIERLDLAGNWVIQSAPTPNASPLQGATNTAPMVTINTPTSGATFTEGAAVSFAGVANDSEDGDLSAALTWTSSLDGNIGTGTSFTTTLSVGSHTITAAVTDSGGLSGSDAIAIIVNMAVNTVPAVTINAPATGSTFTLGDSISFAGSASDSEDGDLSAGLTWTSSLDGNIGTGASFNTTALSVGSHTITAAITDSGGLSASDAVAIIVEAPSSGAQVLLSEVFYDPAGGDDGLEWVELYNAGTAAADLSGFSLGNGGTTYTTSLVQLSGALAPGATFVVGGPTSSATNANPNFDLVVNFNPDFQNSGTAADGVALFDLPAAAINGSTVPIDAVLYGPNNNNGLIDETGAANPPEVGDASSGSSIERLDLVGNWAIQGAPTPNATPLQGGGNTAPMVTISTPTNGAVFTDGDTVSLTGSATDAEDGDLSASLSWNSSLDGNIGNGASFSTTTLSVGSHTITASVTDSGGLSASDAVTITVQATATPVTVTLTSIAAEDGWVRESSENSNVGGAVNTTASGRRSLRPGDGTSDRQYKVIVSFDTASIPAGATITNATLRLRRGRVRGTDPFTILGACQVDIASGGFGGNIALQASDFEAAATAERVAVLSRPLADGDFSSGDLDATGLAAINTAGRTQLRIFFEIDDNDDGGDDHMGYYSANNGNAANRPQLEVTYLP